MSCMSNHYKYNLEWVYDFGMYRITTITSHTSCLDREYHLRMFPKTSDTCWKWKLIIAYFKFNAEQETIFVSYTLPETNISPS